VFFVWWALLSPGFWINLRGPSSSSSFPLLSRNDTSPRERKKKIGCTSSLACQKKQQADRGRLLPRPNKQTKNAPSSKNGLLCCALQKKKKTRIRRGYFSCFSLFVAPSNPFFCDFFLPKKKKKKKKRDESAK
jgi:hypothetical protein